MHWLSDIRLPAEPEGVREARKVVDAVDAPMTDEQRDDLRLLVSEVATNAIRHGDAGRAATGAPGTIRVRLGLEHSCLRVEVHDRGPGFVARPRQADSRLDSGWGVHFVRTLADRWGSGHDETGAWIVWFEFHLGQRLDETAMVYTQRAVDGAPASFHGDAADAPLNERLASTG